jgi:hypothetical protein
MPRPLGRRHSQALEAQRFAKIEVSTALFQIKANYKKATVWGDLEVTLLPEGPDETRINAKATANVDNDFAAFGSPGRKIIDRFKQGISAATVDATPAAAAPTAESTLWLPWRTRYASSVSCAIKGW